MKLKLPIGQDDLPPVATVLGFDFMVAKRQTYIPGSGPPLAPITVMPPHDKDGFIIDKVQFRKEPRYLVGYEHHPQLKVCVRPQNILDWVSRHALEKWESDQYDAEERRREEEELPAILAREERRRKRLETMSRAAQGIDGRKLKRKRTADVHTPRKKGRAAKPGREGSYDKPAGRRGPPQRHQPEEENVFTSPRPSQHSQHSQQPSLSTPSRGLADQIIIDADSNDEDSIDTDTAIDLQLKGLTSTAQSPRSGSESPSNSNHADTSGEEGQNTTLLKPKRRTTNLSASFFSGASAVATTSSREALKIYEDLERKKISPVTPLLSSPTSSFINQKAPLSSLLPQTRLKEPEPRSEVEELEEDDNEAEYELHQILDEEIRIENGKNVVYYLIDWVGDYENTWEPAENVNPAAIEDYMERSQKKVPLGDSEESDVVKGLFVTPERYGNKASRIEMGRERGAGQVIDDEDDGDESD